MKTICNSSFTTDNYFPLADGSSDAVAYYKLDNSAEDSVSTNDGTESGDVEYRFGKYGQAAVFDGSSSIDTGVTLPSGSNDFSISVWFNKDSLTTAEGIFSTHNSGSSNRDGINLAVLTTGKLYVQVYNNNSPSSSSL